MGAIHAKERERMKAGLRLGIVVLAGVLTLAPAAASAQQANQAANAAPAPPTTVGPQELQNFDLEGKVTRAADQQPPALRPSSPSARSQSPTTQNVVQSVSGAPPQERSEPATTKRATATAETRRSEPTAGPPAAAERAPEPLRQTRPASSVTVSLPRLDGGAVRSSAAAPTPVSTAGLDSPATIPPDHKLSILPWLLAAFALGAGGAFLLLRNRSREAFAGPSQLDAFAAPEPNPTPAPRVQPPPVPAPTPAPGPPIAKRPEPSIPGIVSTRLRPWLEIGFTPIGCLVEDHRVTIEFEIELVNSGSAPARGVLVEASLFNASNSQEQELERFFANPLAEGDRMAGIQPLKRVRITTKVVTEREHVQVYEITGRKVFVPIIAFNALYSWRGGEGQTSASFLLGIDTKREKLAPFRVDLGPRLFSSLAARQLPTGVRR
jgi:hypothetical protein